MKRILTSLLLLCATACTTTLQPNLTVAPPISVSPALGTATTLMLSPSPAPVAASPSPAPSASIPASTKTTIQVPLSTDLAKLLNAAKPNTLYVLPKGKWKILSTVTISAANVSLNLGGSDVTLIPSQGASSNIVARASGFEIYNGHIVQATSFLHSYADKVFMHDLKFDNIVYTTPTRGVYQVYLSDNSLATNNTLANLTVGYVGTVGVYFTGDNMVIKDSTFAGSYGEYPIREEITSFAPQTIPKNALISNVTVDNRINKYDKSAIGIRMGSAVIENSTFYSDIRVGQSNATAVGSNNPSFVIRNSKFMTLHSPELSLIQGANATVDSCTFASDASTRVMAIDAKTKAMLTNNILKGVRKPGGSSASGLYASTINPNPLITETGTKTVP